MSESGDGQADDQFGEAERIVERNDFPHADSDTVGQFAEGLRNLRHANAYPKLTAMQFHTGISKSTISAALKGDRLPSEKTVRTLASFFGADVGAWSRRRRLLDQRTPSAQTEPEIGLNPETGLLETPSASEEQGSDVTGTSGASSFAHVSHTPPMVRRRLVILTAISVALLTASVTSFVWLAISTVHNGAQASTIEHYVDFANGVDPMLTVCRKDSTVTAAEERLNGEVFIEMIYSDRCQAVWGRVTRYDGQSAGNAIHMKIYPINDPGGARTQEVRTISTQSVYTSMLVRVDDDTKICGVASIAQDDKEIEASPQVCI